jgi:gas vesicle protein
MGVLKSLAKFGAGGAAGTATGAAAALIIAPDSGPELQRKLRERLRAAKTAGIEARAARENELIRKFRLTVNDAGALKDHEEHVRLGRTEAIATIANKSV